MSSTILQKLYTPETKYQLYQNPLLRFNELQRIAAYPYHFIANLEGDPSSPLIWLSGSSFHLIPSNQNESINDCIDQLPNIQFESLLFLLTVYQHIPFTQFSDFLNPRYYSPVPTPIQKLFTVSFDYMLYNHQLERLYAMVTGCNYMESISFRKDWNRKLSSARNHASNIIVVNQTTLADVILNRTLEQNGFVYTPDFNAAYRLWQKFEL